MEELKNAGKRNENKNNHGKHKHFVHFTPCFNAGTFQKKQKLVLRTFCYFLMIFSSIFGCFVYSSVEKMALLFSTPFL